jgi:hypothetical protein
MEIISCTQIVVDCTHMAWYTMFMSYQEQQEITKECFTWE